jgi:NitT/TauT family transport system substrate-binding protein
MSAPGPGNLFVAKGVLRKIGLEEGRDYTMQEQQMSVHIGALQSGQFEVGYSLEPVVSMLEHRGIARRLEAGVIATHLLGSPEACAVMAGGVMGGKFLKERPQVAERLARAWAKALRDGNEDQSARDLLHKHARPGPASQIGSCGEGHQGQAHGQARSRAQQGQAQQGRQLMTLGISLTEP